MNKGSKLGPLNEKEQQRFGAFSEKNHCLRPKLTTEINSNIEPPLPLEFGDKIDLTSAAVIKKCDQVSTSNQKNINECYIIGGNMNDVLIILKNMTTKEESEYACHHVSVDIILNRIMIMLADGEISANVSFDQYTVIDKTPNREISTPFGPIKYPIAPNQYLVEYWPKKEDFTMITAAEALKLYERDKISKRELQLLDNAIKGLAKNKTSLNLTTILHPKQRAEQDLIYKGFSGSLEDDTIKALKSLGYNVTCGSCWVTISWAAG